MEIAGAEFQGQSLGGKLLQAEIKETLVVGLEIQLATRHQDLAVEGKEATVGQSPLGVTLLGPRIAEVQVNAANRVSGEPLAKMLGVTDEEVAAKLDAKRVSDAETVLKKDAALQAELNK